MDILAWLTANNVELALGAWGAGLSTLLGLRELSRRRLNLSTTYAFYGTDQIDDEIVIVNLSPVPVFVSAWELAWEPMWFSRRDRISVTPHEADSFKISGEDDFTLTFGEADAFPWGHAVSEGRKLVLTLRIHGRRRRKRLTIAGGRWK